MHLDKRFMTVLAVSLLWALLVAAVFYRLAGNAGGRRRPAPEKQIVVATKAVPAGSVLDKESVALRGVPETVAPAGAFARVEDVVDRPVISAIEPDEPVVEARLAPKGSGMGLGPMIPPGMRAVSVRVNDVVGVAGFVLPGMHVDVLVTGKPPSGGDIQTQTVLQNIAVLSAGQTIQADAKSQPITAPVVTLLVSPREAEALTLANNEGRIQLVLRNSTDRAVIPSAGHTLHELYGASRPVATVQTVAAPVPVHGANPARRSQPAVHSPTQPVKADVPVAAAVEPEQMIVIRGAVKKVEYFSREREGK
jgi:pilus assembly protein CpaB